MDIIMVIRNIGILLLFILSCMCRGMEIDSSTFTKEQVLNTLPEGVKRYVNALPLLLPINGEEKEHREVVHEIVEFMKCFSDSNGKGNACTGQEELESKISNFMKSNKSIKCILVGFPCKSNNTDKKTLGVLPDLGELVALFTLDHINEQIKKVYNPGLRIMIYSDPFMLKMNEISERFGYTFMCPEVLKKYHQSLQELCSLFPELELGPYEQLREIYEKEYCKKEVKVNNNDLKNYTIFLEEELDSKICRESIERKLFVEGQKNPVEKYKLDKSRLNEHGKNFIEKVHAMKFEDARKHPFYKKTYRSLLQLNEYKKKLRDEMALGIAEGVMRTRLLLEQNIPDYSSLIRFSIHLVENPDISKKLGIALIQRSRGTPWHNTPVVTASTFKLLSGKKVKNKGTLNHVKIGSQLLAYKDLTTLEENNNKGK